MSKETDKPVQQVQEFSDFAQFLATHRQGPAIKKAAQDQGIAQVQPTDQEPAASPVRKPSGP